MSATSNRVVALKTRAPLVCVAERPSNAAVSSDLDAALNVPCVRDGHFCLCWMPAWFLLAERVGAERLQAGAQAWRQG